MSKIDYSKWDNIELSSEDESLETYSNCKVTRFDTPQSITIGKEDISKNTKLNEKNINCYISKDKDIKLSDFVFGGKSIKQKDYYWTQSENNLKIVIILDSETDTKNLQVKITELKLIVIYKSELIFSEEFQFAVNDNDETIFWYISTIKSETDTENKKVLVIELEKKKIDSSLRLWWKNIFKGGKEISIEKFKQYSIKEEARNRQFIDSWKKAHEEFKEKIKNKISI